jgi:hypothetical protein
MQGSVTLEYSTDAAATFLQATDFGASSDLIKTQWIIPFLMPEKVEGADGESMTDDEICSKQIARLYLRFILETKQFDLTTTNGIKLYQFINALRCAPLIRLYAGSGISIYGYDEFAASNNTNYLIPHDTPEPGEITVGASAGVQWNFTLKCKKSYSIVTA